MTAKKVLELLNDVEFSEKYQGVQEYTEMLIVCKEALEKQIPKKPYLGEILGYKSYLCPTCRGWLLYPDERPTLGDLFCSFCGQKIDWPEVYVPQSKSEQEVKNNA